VATFGDTFTDGSSSVPLYFSVKGNIETRIVVVAYGADTNEIGFVVKATNTGSIIFQKSCGTKFTPLAIFSTFCPVALCPPAMDFIVTLTDTFGDGWNGNIFGFRQNFSTLATFGDSFVYGKTFPPFYITVLKGSNIKVVLN
jgi:hypothetical protein